MLVTDGTGPSTFVFFEVNKIRKSTYFESGPFSDTVKEHIKQLSPIPFFFFFGGDTLWQITKKFFIILRSS